MLVKGDTREAKKIVFEIVQVPCNGLPIEARCGIAEAVVQIAGGFDLEAREDSNSLAIGFDDGRGDGFARAILGEKFEERGIAQVFLEISALVEVFGVDLRNGQAVTSKMSGECEESGVFFAHAVKNADGGGPFVGKADNLAAGTTKFALELLDMLGGRMEMLLKKFFEDIHGKGFHLFRSGNLVQLVASSIADFRGSKLPSEMALPLTLMVGS